MNGRSILLLLTAVNILNYLDRFIVAGTLSSIQASLQLNNQYAGWLFSAFVPGYVIFSPIFGFLGDRFSRPKLMALGALLWSAASILTGLAPNFWVFIIARVFVGVGEASFGTIAPGYLKDYYNNPAKLTAALALFFAAIPVGTALAYVIGGLFAVHASWQAAFVTAGAPGLLLALLILRYPEVRSAQAVPPVSIAASVRAVAQRSILWFVIGGYALNSFSLTGIAAFVGKYGELIGFTKDQIGWWFGAILLFAGGFGTFLGGRLASALSRNATQPVGVLLKFVGVTALVGASFVFLAFTTSSHPQFLILCALAELFIFAGMAPVNSIIVLSCPRALVTFTQGITILVLNLFGALPAPIFVGWMADTISLAAGLQSLSVILLGSGLVWTFGSRKRIISTVYSDEPANYLEN